MAIDLHQTRMAAAAESPFHEESEDVRGRWRYDELHNDGGGVLCSTMELSRGRA